MKNRNRAPTGRFLPGVKPASTPNTPATTKGKGKGKNKNKKPKNARKNPPRARSVRDVFGMGLAAVVGGVLAHAGASLARKIAPAAVADVAGIVIPTGIGIAATRVTGKHSMAAAAGAFGVTGASLATSIAEAVGGAQRNPPLDHHEFFLNPPYDGAGEYDAAELATGDTDSLFFDDES